MKRAVDNLYTRGMETEHPTQELSDQDRVLLVFGYLGPLAVLSLVASRREFVKWHAKQGLVLSGTLTGLYVVHRLARYIVEEFMWGFFAELYRAGVWLVVLGATVLMLFCVVRALEGERFKIPFLGDAADRL